MNLQIDIKWRRSREMDELEFWSRLDREDLFKSREGYEPEGLQGGGELSTNALI